MIFVERLAELAKPAIGEAVVLEPGWIVVRFRRVSPRRYRVQVRQPSRRGRSPAYFFDRTVHGWQRAKEAVLRSVLDKVAQVA